LLHHQLKKDSTMSRQGINDYLIVMRTPLLDRDGTGHESFCRMPTNAKGDPHKGPCADPVSHTDETFPVERWQRYASPCWVTTGEPDDEGFLRCSAQETADDSSGINPSNTLQTRGSKEDEQEKHICPLQLTVIRRAIRLWSNPGEVIHSPFAGIGSEGYVALQEGRRFVGAELKRSYYEMAVRNLQEAEVVRQGGLFDAVGGAA
jgi:hypothetical protein